MRRRQAIFLSSVIIAIAALGALSYGISYAPNNARDKISIITTFYPLAFYAEAIGGDRVSVKALIPYNSEVHSWQPSASDIAKANDADILIYNGAGLDHWFEEDILPLINTTRTIVVEATEGITLHEASEGGDEGDAHDHGQYDPHTWVSPHLALQQAQKVYEALLLKDPANSAYYGQRWQELKERFENLDSRYQSELSDRTKNMIFVAHAAFGYLAERYGFEQHGVIGISADQQPSITALTNLVTLMSTHNVYVVFTDPVYSDQYAQVLKIDLERISGHEVQVLKLYLMLGPIDDKDYIGQMEANLNSLKTGLGA
uniref:Zinc ABC transporter substrate-binding protein n=1 Tax=Candidatus Methanomethylicus mesodigestus TaxID=1867258 RepID=A0A7C3FCP8_9CREN